MTLTLRPKTDRANAIFVEIEDVERMELWDPRGVTPEAGPGLRATVLERRASGCWRVVAS